MLATDREQTIVVFIYDNMEWGDRAQIGFNAGDGHTFYMLPEALSDQTRDMDGNTNAGESGFFVFRIDSKLHSCIIQLIIPVAILCYLIHDYRSWSG